MIPINTVENALDKLIEECAEVIHAASKAKKYGMSNWHPDTKRKNGDTLLDELIDVEEAIKSIKRHIPRPSVEEMSKEVLEWYNRSSVREQQEFTTTSFEHLPIYHSSLGRSIRNRFNLWYYPWEEKIVEGVDTSPDHPDAVSMRVIEEVWRKLQND